MKAKVYNLEGNIVGEKDLRDDVFAVKPDTALIHEVVIGIAASARKPYASTKTRGEVRGGGKKPWKQKGTGRARHGSSRSPIWVGGGITFGPRSERDYGVKINKKTRQLAFRMALSDKAADGRLILVDALAAKEGKTKALAAAIGKLPTKGRKLAIITAGRDEMLSRAARNLADTRLTGAGSIGLMDVLGSDTLIMASAAAEKFESIYGKKA
jgi:large subunit ribosomal protein L4